MNPPDPTARSRKEWSLRAIAFGLGAVALGFLAATFVVARAADTDVALLDLRTNALPSVTHLLEARSALKDLQAANEALATVDGSQRGHQLEAALRARVATEAELDRYEATPWYPGERDIFEHRIAPNVRALDAALLALTGSIGASHDDLARASRTLTTSIVALDNAFLDSARLNQAEGERAAATMDLARKRSLDVALALGACSTLLGVFAALIAIRVARRHDEVVRRHEELLRDRAGELELFAQRVAHDLLSPLSSLSYVLDGIAREHPEASTARLIGRGKGSLARSRRLVEAIFDFARAAARPPKGARASLLEGVRDAQDEATGSDPGASAILVVEPFEEREVACERGALFSIVSNLVSNALKFVADSSVQRVTIRATELGDRVRVEVEDTGPGVPRDAVETIFEPYVRAHGSSRPGLGLGLATVKRFAEAYGGAVGVEERRGPAPAGATSAGSVFWVELPLAAPRLPHPGAARRLALPGASAEPQTLLDQKATATEDVSVS